MTLVELLLTVTILGIIMSSLAAAVIVMLRTDSSTVTVTTLAVITKDGMNYIPAQDLKRMCEINGPRATEANMEIGDDV